MGPFHILIQGAILRQRLCRFPSLIRKMLVGRFLLYGMVFSVSILFVQDYPFAVYFFFKSFLTYFVLRVQIPSGVNLSLVLDVHMVFSTFGD